MNYEQTDDDARTESLVQVSNKMGPRPDEAADASR
jgi:hypothetical protein